MRAWLIANKATVGKPRFNSLFDSHGNEMAWCEPSTTYPDGPLVTWRKWAADKGVDPVAIATWKGRLP